PGNDADRAAAPGRGGRATYPASAAPGFPEEEGCGPAPQSFPGSTSTTGAGKLPASTRAAPPAGGAVAFVARHLKVGVGGRPPPAAAKRGPAAGAAWVSAAPGPGPPPRPPPRRGTAEQDAP